MKRAVLALVVVAAGVSAAVAVGAPTRAAGTSPNQKALLQAIQKTAKSTSGHVSFTASLTGGQVGADIVVSGTGGFDSTRQVAKFTVDLGLLANALGGAVGGVEVPKKVDVVASKGVLYVHVPVIAGQVKKGAEWLSFDSASLPASVTKTLNPGALSKVDPQKALAQLASSVTVHKVGRTTVRGSATTHYRMVVSAAKLVSVLPKSQQAAEAKTLRQLNVKTVAVDIYVSDAGVVRRVSTGVAKLVLQPGTPGLPFKLSFDIYDLGTHVAVTVPPAGKTADGSALLAQVLPGGAGG